MRVVLALSIFLATTFLFFGCVRKSDSISKYLNEYKKLSQEELEKDFTYDNDLSTISGLSEQGQKKEVLYFPKNAKKIKSKSIKSSILKKIVFTPNITEIDEYSIIGSDNLTEIVFLNSFKTVGKIGYNLKNLEKITFINSKISEIMNALFLKVSKLSKFEIINSNLEIKNNQLLVKEKDLVKLIYIMDGFNYKFEYNITHILDFVGLFRKTNITELEFPKSIRYVGKNVVTDAKNLKKIVFNLENLEYFSNYAIQNTHLEELIKTGNKNKSDTFDVINNTLISNKYAILLSKNSDLENLDVEKISSYALNKNYAAIIDTLKKIVSKKIVEIGENAFNGSTNIKGEFDFDLFDNILDVGRNIFNGIDHNSLKIKNGNKNGKWNKDWDKR